MLIFFADELCDDRRDLQHTEEGFRGTLLTANVSSNVSSQPANCPQ